MVRSAMIRRTLLLTFSLLAACAGPPAETPAGPVVEAKPAGAWTAGAMVAAANPLAVEAGLQILRAGGSAVDAAIAVQAVLGLVEPQSSGLGGGAFLLHYDAATGDVVAYDGREIAPAGATPDMFLRADGSPMEFISAVKSGRSIGVPGAVAMLALAHDEHGTLTLAQDLAPAIHLAEQGFKVSARLSGLIATIKSRIGLEPDVAAYLTTDGQTPLPEGTLLKNQAYADTLKKIAAEGPAGFYKGSVAAAIAASARRGTNAGTLTGEDLAGYAARRLEPLCRPYRIYLVCGMGPPSSGGLATLETLGLISHFDMASNGAKSVQGWNLLIEAERLAYADRDLYAADDRYVPVPIDGLLDTAYLEERAGLIAPDHAMEKAEPGTPPGAPKRAEDATADSNGTSHFVIVDAAGDVVSMTTTVEGPFGSQRMAAGFFLNNQLTDFSFKPVDEKGLAVANAIAAGKKPRSSMAPTIVFENGRFHLAVGSPGGNAIIAYVMKVLVAALDWKMSPQDAIALPNVVARGKPIVEPGFDPALRAALAALGQSITESEPGEASGLHAIMLGDDGKLVGGADPRREGVARSP